MASAPVPITAEELGTRQAKTIVVLGTEEVLPLKIPAYVKSDSEISFLVRQPSSSAILVNQPFIELQLEFKMSKTDGQDLTNDLIFVGAKKEAIGAKAFGRQLEGLPFLSKCVRTSVVTINGASNTYRNSEYFVPYLRSTVGRAAMAKIGTPWNDFEECYVKAANGFSARAAGDATVMSLTASKQARLFDLANTNEGSTARTSDTTLMVTYREPLFMSVFNGLQGNSLWPTWCSEQNKSPSVLHAQQMSINFNLHDNWAQNLYGLIQHQDNEAGKILSVDVKHASLCCKFVQPPPKYIAAALSANVTYQTNKFMRFKAKPTTTRSLPVYSAGNISGDYAWPNEAVEFQLEAVNFQYMPSVFMIEIAPDYSTKLNYVAAANAARNARLVEMSKEDKRWGICGLDLIINTSPDIVPDRGSGSMVGNSIINLRYNARQLYEMYLQNCSSVERATYDFDTWFHSGCTVLLTSAQMNGILPSCHVRGNVSVQGRIRAVNTMGYKCYVGPGASAVGVATHTTQPDAAVQMNTGAGAEGPFSWIAGQKFEKFECSITGVYSNTYMALDQKSGLVGESVLSEQFGNALRLSAAQ